MTQYYFEITIQDQGKNGSIEIGLSQITQKIKDNNPSYVYVPKLEEDLAAYNGSGYIIQTDRWSDQSMKKVPFDSFSQGDVIGCWASRIWIDDVSYLKIQFIKNGAKSSSYCYLEDGYFSPMIMMNSEGAKIEANFGQTKFRYQRKGSHDNVIIHKFIIIDCKQTCK